MRRGSVFGLLGTGIITFGMIISSWFYVGRSGERYSLLNHFVSELGESPWSAASWAFNYGLILGGALVLIFMIRLWPIFESWFGKSIVGVGVLTSIAGSGVGLYPMNDLGQHIKVALTFFYLGLIVTILFSVYVFTKHNHRFSKLMAAPGIASFLCFFYFLFLTEPIFPEGGSPDAIFLLLENRPAILETAIFEWAVVLSTMVWLFSLSGYVYKNYESRFKKCQERLNS